MLTKPLSIIINLCRLSGLIYGQVQLAEMLTQLTQEEREQLIGWAEFITAYSKKFPSIAKMMAECVVIKEDIMNRLPGIVSNDLISKVMAVVVSFDSFFCSIQQNKINLTREQITDLMEHWICLTKTAETLDYHSISSLGCN